MIDRRALLSDLQRLLTRLEDDLLQRSESAEVPQVGQQLRGEHERAKQAQRTAQNYEDWRSDAITQAAAAWVLSCVFVRFLEDNGLIAPPKVAGPGKELQRARDEHELFFRSHPKLTDRDYLLSVFDELARLPGTKDVFGEHNPIREMPNWLSGDAAGELLRFFQKIDANTGLLVHDFTDEGWDTRFLGDLYQDLSEAARKKYALLQTPEFVEEFILDRTLEPALDEFGRSQKVTRSAQQELPGVNLEGQERLAAPFRMIDPACGSGHFLLGGFRRILDRWTRNEPGVSARTLVQRTLDSIYGVDINPYAVAIARFRLLLVAMKACGVTRLADAPAFQFNLACGDSLLHGEGAPGSFGWHDLDHVYRAEDHRELVRILKPGHYHAVVANPPYITPKDKALSDAYRERYSTCHMKYSLAVPFMQRLFQLARSGYGKDPREAGFVGQITANSFMKREFGKKLIEEYFAGRDGTPGVDLTHMIDTSGAYIPGHGTPTVILFGRNRAPMAKTIRAVMGIRGEPATPDDPARGLVWSAIVLQIDQPGSQSEFVSIADSPRELFHKHPWSIGGGGAAELKEQIQHVSSVSLGEMVDSIGITCFTLEDDVFILPRHTAMRRGVSSSDFRVMVEGDAVRDWVEGDCDVAVFPYDSDFQPIPDDQAHPSLRYLWYARTCLANNKMFGGKTKVEDGLRWYEYGRLTSHKLRTPLSIVYGEVATHNHFVLDRGGRVFKQTAPVIKLPPDASEDDHLALLGLLNGSTACFWLKQVCHNKGSTVDQNNARQRTAPFEDFFAFNATKLQQFPLPEVRPLELATALDAVAQQLASLSPHTVLLRFRCDSTSLRSSITATRAGWETTWQRLVTLQEELDWECYRLYGLTERELRYRKESPTITPGQRAFEVVMARKMLAGEIQTTWFDRHGSTSTTELPADWPDDYKRLVNRRIELIETNRNIALIEQPEYKRRWNTEPWESQLERALRNRLLDRLESYFDFDGRMNDENTPTAKLDIVLTSVARLADIARQDADFMQVGEVYRDDPAFDVERLVADLVDAESVPLLPVLRYKPSGLRKRAEWEQTWELQREEDRLEALVRSELATVEKAELSGKLYIKVDDAPWGSVAWRAFFRSDEDQQNDNPAFKVLDVDTVIRFAQRRMLGDVPVPPKYTSVDFLKSDHWRLRGKLDVPKERWVSFPHCEGPDGTLVIAWAGYDHLQLARSISAYYVDIQERLGGRDDPRLVPLLACLLELVPWLKQWHNEPDAAFDGMQMGDYFEGFINEEARSLPRPGGGSGWTVDEIRGWQPPQTARRKRS
jgi:hypothetical protein